MIDFTKTFIELKSSIISLFNLELKKNMPEEIQIEKCIALLHTKELMLSEFNSNGRYAYTIISQNARAISLHLSIKNFNLIKHLLEEIPNATDQQYSNNFYQKGYSISFKNYRLKDLTVLTLIDEINKLTGLNIDFKFFNALKVYKVKGVKK